MAAGSRGVGRAPAKWMRTPRMALTPRRPDESARRPSFLSVSVGRHPRYDSLGHSLHRTTSAAGDARDPLAPTFPAAQAGSGGKHLREQVRGAHIVLSCGGISRCGVSGGCFGPHRHHQYHRPYNSHDHRHHHRHHRHRHYHRDRHHHRHHLAQPLPRARAPEIGNVRRRVRRQPGRSRISSRTASPPLTRASSTPRSSRSARRATRGADDGGGGPSRRSVCAFLQARWMGACACAIAGGRTVAEPRPAAWAGARTQAAARAGTRAGPRAVACAARRSRASSNRPRRAPEKRRPSQRAPERAPEPRTTRSTTMPPTTPCAC